MWDELTKSIILTINNGISTGVITGMNATNVYDHEPNVFTEYPAISIVPSDTPRTEFADTARNYRDYTFSIKLLQERREFGANKAERVLRTLTDQMLKMFDGSRYLYGDQLLGRGFVQVAPSRWAYIQTDQVDMRMAEILLSCEVIQ